MRRFFLILGIFLSLEPLTKETVIIPATTQTYGTAGDIVYSQMNLMDLLKNLSKTYNSLVDKAKVPEAVWKPQEDLPAEDKNFFVRDNTGVIVGSLDGVAGEATDKAQLVGLGLKIASDPQGAWNSLVSFKDSLDWTKAGSIAKTMAQGIVGYDAAEFDKGGIYAKHATGKVAGTITFNIVTGSVVLGMVNKVPDLLALLSKVTKKLEDLNWQKADIDAFTWDFQKAEDLLKKFDDGTLDPQAWRLMKDTQSKKVHLPTLTKVTELLRDADFMAKLQGGEATLTDILKNASNPLENGTASKLITLTEHLENLRIVVKNHHNVDGFDKVITDLKISTFEKQDGITHSLNHMKELPAGSVQKVDYVFEPEVDGGLPCTNCRFDVQMVKPSTPPANWVKYYEYKSYLKAQNISLERV